VVDPAEDGHCVLQPLLVLDADPRGTEAGEDSQRNRRPLVRSVRVVSGLVRAGEQPAKPICGVVGQGSQLGFSSLTHELAAPPSALRRLQLRCYSAAISTASVYQGTAFSATRPSYTPT
jgi:hypothetical protein